MSYAPITQYPAHQRLGRIARTTLFVALAVGGALGGTLGQAEEQDLAQAITPVKNSGVPPRLLITPAAPLRKAADRLVRSGPVRVAPAAAQVIALSQASEQDLSQAITARKAAGAGQSAEQDQAQAFASRKTLALSQSSEQDQAQPFTVVQPSAPPPRLVIKPAVSLLTDPVRRKASQPRYALSPTTNIYTLSQSQEQDQAQAVAARKALALSQSSEQDQAQTLAASKRLSLAQASEQDLAQAVTAQKRLALAQANEQDRAQPIARGAIVGSVSQVNEQDLSQALSSRKTLALSQSSEQDQAQPFTVVQPSAPPPRLVIKPAVSLLTDPVRRKASQPRYALSPSSIYALSQVNEQNQAQAITARKTRALAQTEEQDQAQAIARSGALAQVQEQDLAQPITVQSAAVLAPKVVRAPRVQPDTGKIPVRSSSPMGVLFIGGAQTVALAQAQEQDQAQAITPVKNSGVPPRLLITPAAPLRKAADRLTRSGPVRVAPAAAQVIALSQASEQDLSQALTSRKTAGVGQSAEQDQAQAFTAQKRRALAQAEEQDFAQPISTAGHKIVPVAQAAETDAAQPISWAPKARRLSQASETDAAPAITAQKRLALAQASEQDQAQALGRLKTTTPGQVDEADAAQAIVSAKQKGIGQASENDQSQPIIYTVYLIEFMRATNISATAPPSCAAMLGMLPTASTATSVGLPAATDIIGVL